ncbi:MAG: hypothetical protein AB1305_05090 [Candidatus Hadarchaeota archaeon]
MQIQIKVNYIAAERFWEQDQPAPGGVNISTNINIVGFGKKGDDLSVPFVATIAYTPSIAQINIKGQAIISGEAGELDKIKNDYENKKAPPPMLLQAITNTSLIEATVVSRAINIIPPIPLPSIQQAPPSKPDKERPSYVG